MQVTVPARAAIDAALRPTRAEVDLAAIRHNVRVVRSLLREQHEGPGRVPALWGVVKADGYGHGAVEAGLAMVRAGAEGLCVALVEEGIELRAAGVSVPVLVMSGVYRNGLSEALDAGLTPVVHDASQLEYLARWGAENEGSVARVHLKVDTGMARVGITPEHLARVSERLAAMRHVDVDGLMTHFACADEDDPSYTRTQLARFAEARAVVARAGLAPRVFHAANSAGAFRFPEARFDAVRPGVTLYGIAPFAHSGPALLPALRLRTEVLALREVPAGAPIGYGGAYVTARRSVIATLPVGYADGFFRRLSSEAEVLVRGRRARVVGNVSMDMCMIDVTAVAHGPGVSVGDEAVLLGSQHSHGAFDSIRAEEIAARVGTIPYEVLTAVSRRVPRAYLRENDEARP